MPDMDPRHQVVKGQRMFRNRPRDGLQGVQSARVQPVPAGPLIAMIHDNRAKRRHGFQHPPASSSILSPSVDKPDSHRRLPVPPRPMTPPKKPDGLNWWAIFNLCS
ncbi:hypothetical protein J3459_006705 [Metarhizium acridum]|nr:hypothetical protein J3459_006705 [Metarhizium acridum]